MSTALLLMQLKKQYQGTHLKHLQILVLAKCSEAQHDKFTLARELNRGPEQIDRVIKRLQERGFLDEKMRVIKEGR